MSHADDRAESSALTNQQGLFIVLEGIDGAGTTTQAKRLANSLAEYSIGCHLTREPTDNPIGKLLREILTGAHRPTDATTLGLLFAADRADHLQREIFPALQAGKVVISDRYYHSSLAYQGSEEDREWISQLNKRARSPDRTFFLKVDPEVAATRRKADDRDEELFDSVNTQLRVAQGYEEVVRSLSPDEDIVVLDGHQSLDTLSADILRSTLALLGREHEG
ncbi:MAG: dTMP kinase [Kofleriaceae bacterium]|nr:dTMP kinase [Kofleriaceae bacterium]